MQVEVVGVRPLRFSDGGPVRGASAIVPYDGGWLVVQDDATHACLLPSPDAATGVRRRVLPAVQGHEVFSEAAGTKQLKPDLEAAVAVDDEVLLLGSGSRAARMRAVLVPHGKGTAVVSDLSALYVSVARALGVGPGQLNMEGACVEGDALRWFQRGLPASGLPTASVDVDLEALIRVCRGEARPATVDAGNVRILSIESDGVGLAVTDAVALPGGQILVSAAAEDTPNAYDDGMVLASALALLDGDEVREVSPLPELAGGVAKIEGLALIDWAPTGGQLLATIDADDPTVPSMLLKLEVSLSPH